MDYLSRLLLIGLGMLIMCSWTSVIPDLSPKISTSKWQKLAQQKVNFRMDKDEIIIDKEGTFTAIRLKAKKYKIKIHRFVIFFGNGDRQEVSIDQSISKDGMTEIIKLEGKWPRYVKKLQIWYDMKTISAKDGRLEVWGVR